MTYSTLITPAQLAAQLNDPACVVVDCRFALDDVDRGRRDYLAAHIPGAAYAHLDADLSGPKTGRNGRHPLPDPDVLQRTLSRLGVGTGTQVVAYDEGSGMYASRLWWLLRWMGHDAVAVLDGGIAAWTADGRPTSAGDESRTARDFSGVPRADMLVDADAVARIASIPDWRLIDARAPERYRGDTEPLDRVAGHIPGAVNHFFKSNLAETGQFQSAESLRASLGAVTAGATPDRVVCYCGSGVTACHNLLAMEHAGMHGAKLYPGSWSEWSSDDTRPVARGES